MSGRARFDILTMEFLANYGITVTGVPFSGFTRPKPLSYTHPYRLSSPPVLRKGRTRLFDNSNRMTPSVAIGIAPPDQIQIRKVTLGSSLTDGKRRKSEASGKGHGK